MAGASIEVFSVNLVTGTAAVAAETGQAAADSGSVIAKLFDLLGEVQCKLSQVCRLGRKVLGIFPDLGPRARLQLYLVHAGSRREERRNFLGLFTDPSCSFHHIFRRALSFLHEIANAAQFLGEPLHEVLALLAQIVWICMT